MHSLKRSIHNNGAFRLHSPLRDWQEKTPASLQWVHHMLALQEMRKQIVVLPKLVSAGLATLWQLTYQYTKTLLRSKFKMNRTNRHSGYQYQAHLDPVWKLKQKDHTIIRLGNSSARKPLKPGRGLGATSAPVGCRGKASLGGPGRRSPTAEICFNHFQDLLKDEFLKTFWGLLLLKSKIRYGLGTDFVASVKFFSLWKSIACL